MSKEIEYLTFEGGGGKGIVYLGAIKALEKKELSPLPLVEKYKSRELVQVTLR